MEYNTVRFEKSEHVATITLNRPDNMNTYNPAMLNELVSILQETATDDGVRAVILTGAGRAFSAGADVKGFEGLIGLQKERAENQDALKLLNHVVL
ncbi:MAG: enoyl-CoA hydratase-related protein, partial [Candidatus Latescibacteria bacterium]|nr:enoyl-CoA hydratase-related protein [Candidatus Latescibacterota bacterium]